MTCADRDGVQVARIMIVFKGRAQRSAGQRGKPSAASVRCNITAVYSSERKVGRFRVRWNNRMGHGNLESIPPGRSCNRRGHPCMGGVLEALVSVTMMDVGPMNV
jgi:hypothetical protein